MINAAFWILVGSAITLVVIHVCGDAIMDWMCEDDEDNKSDIHRDYY